MVVDYKEKIVIAETGEESWRDYTAEEIAKIKESQEEAAAKMEAANKAATARAALLEKLGITEQEAKLLLS